MDFENEKKNHEEKPATEQTTGSREGYPTAGNGYQREYRGRSPRPRIQHSVYSANRERPSYNRQNNDDGGFRPEGFGTSLQGGYPRQQGGYQPRQQGGGYRPRTSSYNNNGYGQQHPPSF